MEKTHPTTTTTLAPSSLPQKPQPSSCQCHCHVDTPSAGSSIQNGLMGLMSPLSFRGNF